MSKLPPITEEEERGIELLREMLDAYDYVENKPTDTFTEEEIRLMDLGFRRYFAEELEDFQS